MYIDIVTSWTCTYVDMKRLYTILCIDKLVFPINHKRNTFNDKILISKSAIHHSLSNLNVKQNIP